jgi:hypothetical protein
MSLARVQLDFSRPWWRRWRHRMRRHLGLRNRFSVTKTGTESVLYRFAGGSDGAEPGTKLINVNGALFGTTYAGGGVFGSGCSATMYCGTIFGLTTTGNEKVLYSFVGGSGGAGPLAGLIDVNRKWYGTTYSGGKTSCSEGCGTVFAFTP